MSLPEVIKSNKTRTIQTDKIACIIGIEEFRRITFQADFDKSKYIAICIHNPDLPTHEERNINDLSWPQYVDGFKDVLEVKFWDITEDMGLVKIISDETAKTIQEFILKNKDEQFIIHCTAGISRSAGVGKAIECITNFGLGEESKYIYMSGYKSEIDSYRRYSPNLTVFDKIVKNYG